MPTLPWELDRPLNPAGALASTVSDRLRYGCFHLGEGTAPGVVQLPRDAVLLHQAGLAGGGRETMPVESRVAASSLLNPHKDEPQLAQDQLELEATLVG